MSALAPTLPITAPGVQPTPTFKESFYSSSASLTGTVSRVAQGYVDDFSPRDGLLPLMGRITNKWQEVLMIGGALLSTISAVAALSFASTFFAVSCAASAVIMTIAAGYMRYYSALQALEGNVLRFEQENAQLRTNNQEYQTQNTTHRAHIADLANNIRLASLQVDQIRSENAAFRTANEAYLMQNAALTANNGQFQQQNGALRVQVDQLHGQNTQLQGNVASLEHQVQALAAQVRLVTASADQLRASATAFEGHNEQFDTSLGTLTRQIDASRILMTGVEAQFGHQREAIELQLTRLETQLRRLESGEMTAALTAQAGQLTTQVGTLTEQARAAQSALNAATAECSSLQGQYTATFQQLQALREEFDRQLQAFGGRNQELAGLVGVIDQALARHGVRPSILPPPLGFPPVRQVASPAPASGQLLPTHVPVYAAGSAVRPTNAHGGGLPTHHLQSGSAQAQEVRS